jgi:hypothetical protein
MATPQSVLALTIEAANEAAALAGTPSLSQQVADLEAQLSAANTQNAALQTKLTNALALARDAIDKDTLADQQEAARLNALLAELS